MSFFALLLFSSMIIMSSTKAQPSPGYYPSSKIKTMGFNSCFKNLWGPQHQSLSSDGSSLTVWLDKSSGSGFKSKKPYRNGYFGVSMKLQGGYTAGVIASFYLSNNQAHRNHDEVDIEFLGTIPGKPYTLQTNVYVKGSGDGNNIVGREMRFHLWFDPTASFHHYAILWNPDQILFFVDNVPIRQYPRKNSATYPERPMWAYGSVWDASDWATDGGRYKANYHYQPFVSEYSNFKVGGCSADANGGCSPVSPSPSGRGLCSKQISSMKWVQSKYMVYDYCKDAGKDHSLTPECRL